MNQNPDTQNERGEQPSETERLKHWQECEIPGWFNDVPKAKGICDRHAGAGSV